MKLKVFLTVLVGLMVATSCGSSTPDETAAPTSTASASEGPDPDAAFPRTVEHAMGSTEIPEAPERVVVLDTGELDSVLSLGVKPVGAVTTDVDTEFLSYLQEAAAGVEVVGTIETPNLEAIAALRPDLILSNKVRHEELYDEFSQIAPTVFAEEVGAVWKDNLGLAAEALGLEDEADAGIEAYEEDAAALGQTLDDPSATTVGALRFVEGTIRVYRPESFIGTVLTDIGVDQVELPLAEFPAFTEISAEQLEMAEADIIVYASFGPAEDSGELEVLAGPLWSGLTAVEEGRAFAVDGDVYYSGIGLTAASLIVEDIADKLAS